MDFKELGFFLKKINNRWMYDQDQYSSECDNPEVFTQAWVSIFVCFVLYAFDTNNTHERLRVFLSLFVYPTYLKV